MSEFPPPGVSENTVVPAAQAVSSDAIDSALNEFREWLRQAAPADTVHAAASPEEDAIDLSALLREFVSLKHEVNLQTRASRSQLELNSETLEQLSSVLARVEQQQKQSATSGNEERLRPLLKTLVDVYDALTLAQREALRVHEILQPYLTGEIDAPAAAEPFAGPMARPSFWARWFGNDKTHAALHRELDAYRERLNRQRQGNERAGQLISSLVAGYTMSLQRIERALRQHNLEVMECVGQPFDPERMEAVEVVQEGGREGSEVVGEVRRGYVWQGRVFRCAQVRVAKP
jgi:molecular chaperone GrpE